MEVPFVRLALGLGQNIFCKGCHHWSVDLSAPTIPGSSPKHAIYTFINFVLYLSCEKNENKQKEGGFGPFQKNCANQDFRL